MKFLVCFLAIICSILNHINSAVVVPINQSKLTFSEKFNGEKIKKKESSDESEFCQHEEYQHKFVGHEHKTQIIWVTWKSTKAGDRVVLPNICSAENGLPLKRRCHIVAKTLQWEKYDNETILIDCRISMTCSPEIFAHYVVSESGDVNAYQNIWKQATIGEYASLRDLCLQPNGLHLTRKCYYDVKEQKAKWVPVDHLKDVKCLQHVRQPIISNELNNLHENIVPFSLASNHMTTSRQTCTTLLSLLGKQNVKLLPADIQMTSRILKNTVIDSQDTELSRDVLQITHKLMSIDAVVLRMSAELNATNVLLETFENYMDGITRKLVANSKCHQPLQNSATAFAAQDSPVTNSNDASIEVLNLSHIGVYAYINRNISVFFVSPLCANISGIAIYDSYQTDKQTTTQQEPHNNRIRYDSLNDLYYRFIFMNESISGLLREDHLELASFVPIDLWTSLQPNFNSSFLDTPVAVFKIYAHDGLFIEQKLLRSRKPFGKILSISLPGFSDKLPKPLPFILRHKSYRSSFKPNSNTGCGYWNYSTWISSGVHSDFSAYSAAGDLILCSTNHLTQFTYLLGGSYRQNDLSGEVLVTSVHQQALDIISLLGCTLSLLGLLGIWITALLFKSWRSQASNKILLNMCAALTLQMLLFLYVTNDDTSKALVEHRSYTECVILGALLQYLILVLFTWMLIVALLQFQRYVTVIGIQRPSHYIIKSALLAWALPLLPTLLVALLDPKSYIPNSFQLATDTGICYPSGKGLHFGIILPVSLIILVNFSIFVHVLYSISHTLSMSMQRYEKQIVYKQIRLSILLFFLLGLSWIFGLFAFARVIVFSYLFCLTATLQGFVLFVYFVIMDEIARKCWRKMLCPSRIKKSERKLAAEIQSMTTTSLAHENNSSREH